MVQKDPFGPWRGILSLLLFLALLLSAFGAESPLSTLRGTVLLAGEAAMPEPIRESPPAPGPADAEWTLTEETAEDILALAELPGLRRVNAEGSREYAALLELRSLRPDMEIRWQVPLQGKEYPDDTRELILDSTEGLEEALAGLPCVETVDLSACRPALEEMDRLYDLYPQVEFLWTFTMGQEGRRQWEIRSDITCFSSLWTGNESYRYTEEDYYPLLRFCRHLRALDLGHSDIEDIHLIGELTELQVLILADNPRITDISPLANLHELVYLELFLNFHIEDFSCLYSMPKLMDLNLSYCENLDDVGFIDLMPDFQNGWFRNSEVTWDMVKPYWDSRPGIRFVVGSPEDWSSVVFGWRETKRAAAIRHAFSHWQEVEDFRSWDEVVYRTA
ncbi:MAG: leucine-rich repeat domain-containing protein [Oscillospiraceae bacterium]|nr:leucine-rich repeat domain-containing protein [Oscillospiraceae bacterium]